MRDGYTAVHSIPPGDVVRPSLKTVQPPDRPRMTPAFDGVWKSRPFARMCHWLEGARRHSSIRRTAVSLRNVAAAESRGASGRGISPSFRQNGTAAQAGET